MRRESRRNGILRVSQEVRTKTEYLRRTIKETNAQRGCGMKTEDLRDRVHRRQGTRVDGRKVIWLIDGKRGAVESREGSVLVVVEGGMTRGNFGGLTT